MPEDEAAAVMTSTTDRDTLRKMCNIRGIEYHHANKAPALQRLIDEYEVRNAPTSGTSGPKVDVNSGTGFADASPQTPDWVDRSKGVPITAKNEDVVIPLKPDPAAPAAAHRGGERYEKSTREMPAPVVDALKWFGAYSIGRANIVQRYIESLL